MEVNLDENCQVIGQEADDQDGPDDEDGPDDDGPDDQDGPDDD